ncbi:uncharacterized protein LOC123534398 isoform X2 [Mercenaria mercenaria]|uniref:uncharacterized protein LOC123534398 isoform X2 n=1 Tax=Mercenaria mercenaria TaxID=6596 RepID=UPI00234F50BB|nr:uncharacterized protein LOC123534398 isoform X2 [Mercenaria mercenaria]
MLFIKPEFYCLLLSFWFWIVKGGSLPWPDFESGWLPIKNGLEHVARLNIDHGLGEIPVLVDVSVKIKDHIFPASGFRPDHPKERSGPVVYIYDDMYVNVSTSPIEDPLYRIFPTVLRQYEGKNLVIMGEANVRIRAWRYSSFPAEDFKKSGIMLKANTSKVSDSYAEVNHNLDEMPCLVIVRMKMYHGDSTIMADGVGSSMQVFADVPDRTNAYLVYGYSNTTFRLWVDSSIYGAIFDGRKHTWFDMVISEGEAEIYAWKCSTVTPQYNKRVVTKYTMDEIPSWLNVVVEYDLEPSFIRVSVLAEEPGGANEGFRFPGAFHLGYPAPLEVGNSLKHTTVGGLSYTYETKSKFNFFRSKYFGNKSIIFIATSFGDGTNSEMSNSESVYIQSFIYQENGGCPTPVIPNGFANMSIKETATVAKARVHCNEGFVMQSKEDSYIHDHERFTITCHTFGYWENIPKCIPKEKEVGNECNPAVDKCRDIHASCTLIPEGNVYKCACNDGYRHRDRFCKAQGKYLQKADYDSDWISLFRNGHEWYLELEHGLDKAPVLVDVQVDVDGYVFHAIGFPPNQDERSWGSSAVVYIYDERYINVSTFLPRDNLDDNNLISRSTNRWYGYQYYWSSYGRARARAWKSESLPTPDLTDDSKVLRANSSTASDSFYELEHNLGEYPGLVVVRAKMMNNGSSFYADGVGSALNVFYNQPGFGNAFLVYGFNDRSVRTWVDSSVNGAIFDGKETKLNIVVSVATVEIYAWKISTLTPFFTYMFSLEDDRFPYSVEFPMNYPLSDALNVAVAHISDSSSPNQGFRFPSSAYLADRNGYHKEDSASKCIFGGFMYGYETGLEFRFSRERDIKILLYKPSSDTGALVCIPESFGDGKYSDAAFNGIGIMYSWINGDCGPPPETNNGFINTTINGTEIGAVAVLECNEGYRLSYNSVPVCGGDMQWELYTSCDPVVCDTVEAPANGTMDVNGQTVTFQCDTGYRLNGAEVIECLSTGNWSANTPSCSLHTEDDNKTSRSMREQVNVMHILLAVSMYIIVFIENS